MHYNNILACMYKQMLDSNCLIKCLYFRSYTCILLFGWSL